jgi:hypothetical protein
MAAIVRIIESMTLLDHFRPPLSNERHWESFHTTWAGSIADALNQQLPDGYFAEEQLHPSARVEIDVATFEQAGGAPSGGIAVADRKTWKPAAPTWTIPGLIAEGIELLVFQNEGGLRLVGAIELISPANKDRPESRRAFASKCASYLHAGVGLAIVDVVTSRNANLHNDLMQLLSQPAGVQMTAPLYAVAYRPVRRGEQDQVEIWPADLAIGKSLPELPLWLAPDLVIPVALEPAYQDACRRRRIA